MLSRKDVRANQIQLLLDAGFLPVSVDYRLCPEMSLIEGPMQDVRDALRWARQCLPSLPLARPDIRPNGDQVVAIGWSTGGHLAMSLAWTAAELGLASPEAVLAFYPPTDYSDPFWSRPNFPFGKQIVPPADVDIRAGMTDTAITAYNPPRSSKALGGWMSTSDPRSQIALHMNWTGQTIPVLLNGSKITRGVELPRPTKDEIARICPTSQASAGNYCSPTLIIHGSLDDLIPIQQVKHTCKVMRANGVEIELRELEGSIHLFDIAPVYGDRSDEVKAVTDGIQFLRDHVQY
jgi:acetyl esterase/lipase